MNQIEITEKVPLLDENGTLTNPGYSKRNNFIYNRENIKASKWRIKEWNYYQVSNGKYIVIVNFYDISLASGVSVEIWNMKTGQCYTDSILDIFTQNKDQLDRNGDEPYTFTYQKNGKEIQYDVNENCHHIYYKGKTKGMPLEIDLQAEKKENLESITMAMPFHKDGEFFYTQKLNCMPTHGYVKIQDRVLELNAQDTYTVMDWARGVWPHSNMWYWANGSTTINDKLFGFELTWGFGDDSYASETAVFYDGKCHKIGKVSIEKDPEEQGFMEDWHIISEDGRLDLTMKPFFNRATGKIVLNQVGMKADQLHGYWNGKVILDDGTVLEIKDMYAFCEKVKNKW